MIKLDTKEELGIRSQELVAGSSTCESTAYIPMTINTPISLKPCIRQLPISISLCGEPVLEPGPCGKYILTQELLVKVPIEISVNSNIGNTPPCCGYKPGISYPNRPGYSNPPNVIVDKQPMRDGSSF